NSTVYYWKVVAKNSSGSTSSAIWSFTTDVPVTSGAPSAPASPSPASGATGVSTTPTLSWAASSNATSYDVYFGTSSSPALAKNVTTPAYKPPTLATARKSNWKAVARNTATRPPSADCSTTTA